MWYKGGIRIFKGGCNAGTRIFILGVRARCGYLNVVYGRYTDI